MMRKLTIVSALVAMLAACHHGPGHSPLEGQARRQGAEAAAAVVAVDHADTLALQEAILNAKALQSRYALMPDTVAVRVFDEAFRQYVSQHDDALYRAMFR